MEAFIAKKVLRPGLSERKYESIAFRYNLYCNKTGDLLDTSNLRVGPYLGRIPKFSNELIDLPKVTDELLDRLQPRYLFDINQCSAFIKRNQTCKKFELCLESMKMGELSIFLLNFDNYRNPKVSPSMYNPTISTAESLFSILKSEDEKNILSNLKAMETNNSINNIAQDVTIENLIQQDHQNISLMRTINPKADLTVNEISIVTEESMKSFTIIEGEKLDNYDYILVLEVISEIDALPEASNYTYSEVLDECLALRAEGNSMFTENSDIAKKNYQRVIDLLFESVVPPSTEWGSARKADFESTVELKDIFCKCSLNLTKLKLREGEIAQSIRILDNAIKVAPTNFKLVYRRAECYLHFLLLDDALSDIQLAMQLISNDVEKIACNNLYHRIREEMIKYRDPDSKVFRKMLKR